MISVLKHLASVSWKKIIFFLVKEMQNIVLGLWMFGTKQCSCLLQQGVDGIESIQR